MGADHAAELLPDDGEGVAVKPCEIDGIGHIRRIELDRQAGGQVEPEMFMGNQDDGALRQHIDEGFSDDVGHGVVEGGVVDLPDRFIGGGDFIRDLAEIFPVPDDHGGDLCASVQLPGGRHKFECRVVRLSVLVKNICKHLSAHDLIPPLAFKSSISFSMISSVLPESISAPSPRSGTK